MANLKPILEELKALKENINSDSIRELVLSNFQENREKIEDRLKTLADTTKNNPVVNEYLDQILKAELTNQAVAKLQASFPDHELVRKITDLRESLINKDDIADPTPFASSELEEQLEAKAEAQAAATAKPSETPGVVETKTDRSSTTITDSAEEKATTSSSTDDVKKTES